MIGISKTINPFLALFGLYVFVRNNLDIVGDDKTVDAADISLAWGPFDVIITARGVIVAGDDFIAID